jgi:hypothetical protein
MRSFLSIFILVCITTAPSCREPKKKDLGVNPAWHKLSLPNGWVIYAPANFTSKTGQGADSEPGWIISQKDSISLEFDSGTQAFRNKVCDFDENVRKAKTNIDSGFYRTYYKAPFVHKACIDTIDGKIAILVVPTKTGKGTVGVEISDCKTGTWLGISGKNITADNERLLLEIYNTIRQTRTK